MVKMQRDEGSGRGFLPLLYHLRSHLKSPRVVFYLLGPKIQLLVDKLDELRVAKREKIDNFVDPPQELVSSEVSLWGQRGRGWWPPWGQQ